MTAGLALALGLCVGPAGATVTGTAKISPAGVVPAALSTCLTGVNNSYEFYTWCKGTSPTSFRTIALCANDQAVLGAEYADGSGSLSYANCDSTDNLHSTLSMPPDPTPESWGILECSNSNGAGTFAGYIDTKGDISWILLNAGNNSIPTGGTTLCDYSTTVPTSINPNVPL